MNYLLTIWFVFYLFIYNYFLFLIFDFYPVSQGGAEDVKSHKWFRSVDWDIVPQRKLKVFFCICIQQLQNYWHLHNEQKSEDFCWIQLDWIDWTWFIPISGDKYELSEYVDSQRVLQSLFKNAIKTKPNSTSRAFYFGPLEFWRPVQ